MEFPINLIGVQTYQSRQVNAKQELRFLVAAKLRTLTADGGFLTCLHVSTKSQCQNEGT